MPTDPPRSARTRRDADRARTGLRGARTDTRAHRDERLLRKRENTRAALVEAAAEVIAAKGLEAARIDDVVAAAGFTRGAFYSNYSSLEEVLSEAVVARSQALLTHVTEAVSALGEEVTLDTLMELLESIRPDARSIYLISTEYTLRRMRHPETPEVPAATRQAFTAAMSGIVEDILARMGRRALVPAAVIADVVSLFFLDSISQEAAGTPSSSGIGLPDHDALRLIIDAIIRGLSAPLDVDTAEAPAGSDHVALDPAFLSRLAPTTPSRPPRPIDPAPGRATTGLGEGGTTGGSVGSTA